MGVQPARVNRLTQECDELYLVDIHYKYKIGLESENAAKTISKELLKALRACGIIPKSYSETFWSSNMTGWLQVETYDLGSLRNALKYVRKEKHLESYLDLDITVGTHFPMPTFEMEIKKGSGIQSLSPSLRKDSDDYGLEISTGQSLDVVVWVPPDWDVVKVEIRLNALGDIGIEGPTEDEWILLPASQQLQFTVTRDNGSPSSGLLVVELRDRVREQFLTQDEINGYLWGAAVGIRTT